ncbi:MFS transporter [Actinophytocola sp.]|uniref:MFS transporter n=1 Tax=Actinophytocola sp. TaxID=1872138 RepID=UPI002E192951
MSTQQTAVSQGRANLVLATLFLGMFVLGTAELIVVGVLDLIAGDLRVSIPAAGTLVTAAALGLAFGGPILTVLTLRLNKRTILIGALVLFILGNLVPVLTDSYGWFLTARIITGALQGLFIATGFVTGISVVPPEKMGRAISAVFSGVAVSAALGVPLSTLIGQALGWRGAFVAIIILSVVVLLATIAFAPSVAPAGGSAGNQAKYAFAPRVLAVLALNFAVFASLYAALTYIVPFLQDVTGISGAAISIFLLVYGVSTVIGSGAGGRFADKNAKATLIVATFGTAAALLVLYLGGTVAFLVAIGILAWGLFAMGMVPSLQYRVITLAGPGGAVAQSLPASAANIGIAFGSFIGGVAIGGGNAKATIITGFTIAVISGLIAWATSYLKPPVVEQPAAPQTDTAPDAEAA